MKHLILFLILFFALRACFGQDSGPQEITPQILQKLKNDIEKQIPSLKQKLSKQYFNADQIEFSLDTFRVNQLCSRRIEIDYSTMGMNVALEELADSYDKLMNKYYNKLLKSLKPDDQEILINAQRAWLAYRDANGKLIDTLTKEEYSGGGSIQSNVAIGRYEDLVEERAIQIFDYYSSPETN
jgi:uncharacterized protein YecT (DUF1311 family)